MPTSALHGVGGKRDDGRPFGGAFGGANGGGGLEAVHFRHLAIHEDKIEAAATGGGHGFSAVLHHFNFGVEALQDAARADIRGDILALGEHLGKRPFELRLANRSRQEELTAGGGGVVGLLALPAGGLI